MKRILTAIAVAATVGAAGVASAAFVNPGRFVAASAFSRLMLPQFILLREISAVIFIVLAVIGLAIILQPAAGRPPDIIEN